jgi:hypothetical protein
MAHQFHVLTNNLKNPLIHIIATFQTAIWFYVPTCSPKLNTYINYMPIPPPQIFKNKITFFTRSKFNNYMANATPRQIYYSKKYIP